jgi:hypothetical protein
MHLIIALGLAINHGLFFFSLGYLKIKYLLVFQVKMRIM